MVKKDTLKIIQNDSIKFKNVLHAIQLASDCGLYKKYIFGVQI